MAFNISAPQDFRAQSIQAFVAAAAEAHRREQERKHQEGLEEEAEDKQKVLFGPLGSKLLGPPQPGQNRQVIGSAIGAAVGGSVGGPQGAVTGAQFGSRLVGGDAVGATDVLADRFAQQQAFGLQQQRINTRGGGSGGLDLSQFAEPGDTPAMTQTRFKAHQAGQIADARAESQAKADGMKFDFGPTEKADRAELQGKINAFNSAFARGDIDELERQRRIAPLQAERSAIRRGAVEKTDPADVLAQIPWAAGMNVPVVNPQTGDLVVPQSKKGDLFWTTLTKQTDRAKVALDEAKARQAKAKERADNTSELALFMGKARFPDDDNAAKAFAASASGRAEAYQQVLAEEKMFLGQALPITGAAAGSPLQRQTEQGINETFAGAPPRQPPSPQVVAIQKARDALRAIGSFQEEPDKVEKWTPTAIRAAVPHATQLLQMLLAKEKAGGLTKEDRSAQAKLLEILKRARGLKQ